MTILIGGPGSDTLAGGPGNDTLDGAGGADSLTGGKGNDTYFVDDPGDVVSELAGQGTDTVQSSLKNTDLGGAAFANVENLVLLAADSTGTGNALNNVITGNDSSNTLNGAAGKDTLIGGNGLDSLYGGAGTDLLIGGNGGDRYIIDEPGDKIVEAGGPDSGIDVVFAGISHTLAANVEQLFLTGADAINGAGNILDNFIVGNGAANKLSGAAGQDFLFGDAGNDTLDGGAGNDTLEGSLGSDRLLGGAGNDSLFGGTDIDTLAGGMGNDTYLIDDGDVVVEAAGQGADTIETALFDFSLNSKSLANVENLTFTYAGTTTGASGTGNSLNNLIRGGASGDLLRGELGNDTLDGGVGVDGLFGGKGNDTYIVDNAADTVEEKSNEGRDTIITTLVTFTLDSPSTANVENLILDVGAEDGTGNGLANVITGNSDFNDLAGLGGTDTLIGNGGDDRLDGGEGNDLMIGGEGFDRYRVDSAGDKTVELAGPGSGIDRVTSSAVSYTLGANIEEFFLEAGAINGTGNNLSNDIFGNDAANKLSGLAGDDALIGGAGNDTLFGGAGGDRVEGGLGADSMVGGAGDDSYRVDTLDDKVVEAAGQGNDTITTELTSFTLDTKALANVENLRLLGATASSGTGNGLNNVIGGTFANDTLNGAAGNDTLGGNLGADSMIGGKGDDRYNIEDIGDTVTEAAGEGKDTILTNLNLSLAAAAFQNVENLTLFDSAALTAGGNGLANVISGNSNANTISGEGANDTLFGSSGNDTLTGGDGRDSLLGGTGDDSLNGGTGNDTLAGGEGNDTYAVDAAGDKIVELASPGSGFDIVVASVDYVLAANIERLDLVDQAVNGTGGATGNLINGNAAANKLFGLGGNDDLRGEGGSDTLDGGIGNDSLSGSDDNDKLLGGAGNDNLNGELGVDSMAGGAGNDSYVVDNAADQVIEASGKGADIVTAFGDFTYTLAVNVENLDLLFGADGTGNALANRIDGGGDFTGDNAMFGGNGNDTLVGGSGSDFMAGGAGRDTFAIVDIDGTGEVVSDFTVGNKGDRLDLSDLLTGFASGSSNANDFVRFVDGGTGMIVQVDTDGAANGTAFLDVCFLQGVTLTDVAQAVTDGNLLLS